MMSVTCHQNQCSGCVILSMHQISDHETVFRSDDQSVWMWLTWFSTRADEVLVSLLIHFNSIPSVFALKTNPPCKNRNGGRRSPEDSHLRLCDLSTGGWFLILTLTKLRGSFLSCSDFNFFCVLWHLLPLLLLLLRRADTGHRRNLKGKREMQKCISGLWLSNVSKVTWVCICLPQLKIINYLQSEQHTSTRQGPCSYRPHISSPAAPRGPLQCSPNAINNKQIDEVMNANLNKRSSHKCNLINASHAHLAVKPILTADALNHLIVGLLGNSKRCFV